MKPRYLLLIFAAITSLLISCSKTGPTPADRAKEYIVAIQNGDIDGAVKLFNPRFTQDAGELSMLRFYLESKISVNKKLGNPYKTAVVSRVKVAGDQAEVVISYSGTTDSCAMTKVNEIWWLGDR